MAALDFGHLTRPAPAESMTDSVCAAGFPVPGSLLPSGISFPLRVIRWPSSAARDCVFDQPHGVGCGYDRGDIQGTVADRVVFQGPQAIASSKNLCGNFGPSVEDATLDGVDRHTGGEILAVEVGLWLVPIKPGGAATPATVCLPRSVDLDR